MKKLFITLAALMTAFFMISCQNETTSGNNIEEEDTTAEKIDIYNKFVGTTWSQETDTKDGFDGYETLAFKESSVVLGGSEYSIDVTKDLYYYSEIPNTCVINTDNGISNFYIYVNNKYIGFENWIFEKVDYLGIRLQNARYNSYYLVSSSSTEDSSSTTETVTVSGKYNAKGSKSGASTTFANGTWTFSYQSSTKTGSYSQSGNELTINCSSSAGSYSAVFTVSKGDSDSIVKLTGKSGYLQTVVSSAFKTTDTDALTKGNVTLTKN